VQLSHVSLTDRGSMYSAWMILLSKTSILMAFMHNTVFHARNHADIYEAVAA